MNFYEIMLSCNEDLLEMRRTLHRHPELSKVSGWLFVIRYTPATSFIKAS